MTAHGSSQLCILALQQAHWRRAGQRTHNPLTMLSITRADQRPCTRGLSKLGALPVRAGARGGWAPMLYSTRVQQRARITADHGGPLGTAERSLTLAYAAVHGQVPVSGGQGVAGSNPAVPTIFRTLLRHVQQQYSSTRGRLLRSACGLRVAAMRSADSRSRRWAGVDLRPGCYASFAMSAGRHSRRASVAWHANPVGVSAVLTLAPGFLTLAAPVGAWRYPGLRHGR